MNLFQTSLPSPFWGCNNFIIPYSARLLEGLVKTQIAGCHLHSFWFSRPEIGLGTCMSNEFPGDAYAAGLGTLFWELYPRELLHCWAIIINESGWGKPLGGVGGNLSEQCSSSLNVHHLGILLKCRFCISNRRPAVAHAAGPQRGLCSNALEGVICDHVYSLKPVSRKTIVKGRPGGEMHVS